MGPVGSSRSSVVMPCFDPCAVVSVAARSLDGMGLRIGSGSQGSCDVWSTAVPWIGMRHESFGPSVEGWSRAIGMGRWPVKVVPGPSMARMISVPLILVPLPFGTPVSPMFVKCVIGNPVVCRRHMEDVVMRNHCNGGRYHIGLDDCPRCAVVRSPEPMTVVKAIPMASEEIKAHRIGYHVDVGPVAWNYDDIGRRGERYGRRQTDVDMYIRRSEAWSQTQCRQNDDSKKMSFHFSASSSVVEPNESSLIPSKAIITFFVAPKGFGSHLSNICALMAGFHYTEIMG